jgi:spermidine synthase
VRALRRREALLAAAAGLAAAALPASPARADELLESVESVYNSIFVYRRGDLIAMTFGHNQRLFVESQFDPANELALPVRYTRYMTLGMLYPPKLDRLLFIGLGGGRTSWYMHKSLPDLDVTVVELDPEVIRLAKKWFAIREEAHYRIETSDGRVYVQRHRDPADLIMVDAYRGPFVPFHLLTKEFYALLKSRLNAGGCVVQNIEPTTMLFDAAAATMSAVFDNVDFYDALGNIVAVGYDGPKRTDAELRAAAEAIKQAHPLLYDPVALLADRREVKLSLSAEPLTDDFAPVEYLHAIDRHNEKMP